MNAASLMVRIGADVEDFTRGMTKAEKAAKKGFDEIGEAAKKMTEFFSIEFAGAALEFAHLAAEAQDASARLDRVFGAASADVKAQLEQLTHTIPATVAEMQTLAVQSNNMLQGLGFGADRAAQMSVEMVKLAGDMAAFAHVPIADALEALDRGLAGRTKGLIQFGIVVNQQAIHTEAMRRGLIDEHRTLTELGTAEIAASLIKQASTRITGEAARTADQASSSFQFMKQSLEEMGVSVGNILLPPVKAFVDSMRSVVEWMEHTSTGAKTVALWVGGITAAMGPAILLTVRFAKELIALRRAMQLLSAGEGIAAVIGGIAAAPVATVVAALTAIAAAAAAVYFIWQKFKDKGASSASALAASKDALATDPSLDAALAKMFPKKTGPLSEDLRSPLDKFKESAAAIREQYDDTLKLGDDLRRPFDDIVGLNTQALALYDAQTNKLSEMARAARKVVIETKAIMDAQRVADEIHGGAAPTSAAVNPSLASALMPSSVGMLTGAIAMIRNIFSQALAGPSANVTRARAAINAGAMSPDQVDLQTGAAAINEENALRLREAVLKATDAFDATRVAAVELGEKFKQASHDFETSLHRFTGQWSDLGSSLTAGLQDGLASVMDSFSPMALAAQAIGKIMQGFQPILDKLMGPLVAFGQILAQIVQPILPVVFTSLKMFGIALALAGEVVYTVAGGIAKAIGGLIAAIGSVIRKIPFLGGVGKDIQNFGNTISDFGKSALATAKGLDQSRIQLQNLNFDDAANGLNSVTDAANVAAEALYQIPQAFKTNLERYRATSPWDGTYVTPASGSGGSSSGSPSGGGGGTSSGGGSGTDGGGGGGGAITGAASATIIMDGQKVGQLVWNRVVGSAKKQFGSAARVADVVVIH